MLATNFGSPSQMVTKVGSQILATKFGFVPDCRNVSHLILKLSFLNPLKPSVESRMKMKMEQHRQATSE